MKKRDSLSMGKNNFDFGSELGKIRTRTGLTQATLAKLVGVSEVTIRNWESSLSKPKAERLKKLIEVLLQKDAFTKGKELEEVTSLWEQVRENDTRMKAGFDEEWFHELMRNQRSLLVDIEKDIEPKRPEILVEEHEGLAQLFRAGILPGTAPKDTTILPLPPAATGLVGREEDQHWLETCIFADK